MLQGSEANRETPVPVVSAALLARNRDIPNRSVLWRNPSCIASIVNREASTTQTAFVVRSKPTRTVKIKQRKVRINLLTKRQKSTRPVLSATQRRKKRSWRRMTRMRTQTPPLHCQQDPMVAIG